MARLAIARPRRTSDRVRCEPAAGYDDQRDAEECHEAPKWCCSSAARTAIFLQRLGRRVLPNIPLFPRVNQLCLCLREPLFGNAIESDGAPESMNVKNGYVIVMPIILR
jgi:hypothetical protein